MKSPIIGFQKNRNFTISVFEKKPKSNLIPDLSADYPKLKSNGIVFYISKTGSAIFSVRHSATFRELEWALHGFAPIKARAVCQKWLYMANFDAVQPPVD